jgi:hypothetical protein
MSACGYEVDERSRRVLKHTVTDKIIYHHQPGFQCLTRGLDTLLCVVYVLEQFQVHIAETVVLLECFILFFTYIYDFLLSGVVFIGLAEQHYTLGRYLLLLYQFLYETGALICFPIVGLGDSQHLDGEL